MKSWKTAKLRPAAYKVIERISRGVYDENIRYVVLFGSEARGEATLTSDIDIALVSDKPLTRNQRLEYKNTFDDDSYPYVNVINTLTDNLETGSFMDVSYHIKREGLLVYER